MIVNYRCEKCGRGFLDIGTNQTKLDPYFVDLRGTEICGGRIVELAPEDRYPASAEGVTPLRWPGYAKPHPRARSVVRHGG